MNAFIIYTAKVTLYMAGFYLVYFIFLSSDRQYTRNRYFLLLSVILSFILPLLTLKFQRENTIFYLGKTLSEVIVTAEGPAFQALQQESFRADLLLIVRRAYLTGCAVFGLKLVADLISLAILIIRKRRSGTRIIRFKGLNTAGFSAMGFIFISESAGSPEIDAIIRHEEHHLQNYHFYDILFLEGVKVFHWFNPVIYMINRSLRAVHEYQVDAECIKSGISVAGYQNLLLSHIFRSKIFLPSNSFSNPSLLRKRMIMMSKSPSGSLSSLKLALIIPVTALILLFISGFEISREKSTEDHLAETLRSEEITGLDIAVPSVYRKPDYREEVIPQPEAPLISENSNTVEIAPTDELSGKNGQADIDALRPEVFVVVEEMPQYPGGDKALMDFIYSNIEYPETAKARGLQGRVILRFAIMANGKVDMINVIRGVDPELDNEAVRVVKMLNNWKPGRQGGKNVNVWYSVPVTFQLK